MPRSKAQTPHTNVHGSDEGGGLGPVADEYNEGNW